MLRLQSIINASDTLSFCAIGRRKALQNIGSTLIFRTHITSQHEKVLSAITSQFTIQSRNKLLLQNYTCPNVSCMKEVHTHSIPYYQASKTNQTNNGNVEFLLKENVEEDDLKNEVRTKHSKKQLFHKQMAVHSESLEDPSPKILLNTVYSIVESQLKIDKVITIDYVKNKSEWTCNCKVKWPEKKVFSATDRSKKMALFVVSSQCLHWLKEIKKLENGKPVIFDVKQIEKSLDQPTLIFIENQLQQKLKELLVKYNTIVKPIIFNGEKLNSEDSNNKKSVVESHFGKSFFSQLQSRHIINTPRIQPEDRNFDLRKKLRERRPLHYELPIHSYRDKILKKIEENQILLIKGDTGCGKTTQVPQFIMDSYIAKGKASDCNLIITQPRRISATSIAERVAHERGEKLGDVVGYKVKLRHALPQCPGAILFCTTGVLLKKMQENPNLIGCSHLIIDEAHERKIDIDMVLALLKRVVKKNKDIKVIIMSATLNAHLFKNYFDCATLEIPGKIHPVRMHFMEEISEAINLPVKYDQYSFGHSRVEYEEIAKLVQWISNNKPPGAILCFLPGWTEIVLVEKMLKQFNKNGRKQLVLPIHSLLSNYDQQRIFETPPRDVRKIILATDIAETGITVPDVVYVVDSATHKEIRWDKVREIETMQSYKISQANLLQRRGRAGRVRPGESFHFISKDEYENLPSHALPEIKCVSLERVALDCKLCVDDKVEDFLSQLLEPPDPHVVSTSVQNLVKLGALDQDEQLTPLGRKMAAFTISPILSKTIIYSSIFNCVDPILTIATLFSMNIEIFRNAMLRKEEIRNVKSRFNYSSDHLALSWIYMQWEAFLNKNDEVAEKFCDECGLNSMRMLTVKKLKNQYAGQLCDVLGIREKLETKTSLNKYAQSDEIVRAVILAGVDHIVKHVGFEKFRDRIVKTSKAFQDENRFSTYTTPESVNHLKNKFPSSYLTYIKKTFSLERRKSLIRDSSVISPLAVMLFSQGHVVGYEQQFEKKINEAEVPIIRHNDIVIKIKDKNNVSLICQEEVASLLFEFRDSIWAVVRYLIDNQKPLYENQSEEVNVVDKFRREMLKLLDELLTAAAENIDNVKQHEEKQNNDPFSVTKIDI